MAKRTDRPQPVREPDHGRHGISRLFGPWAKAHGELDVENATTQEIAAAIAEDADLDLLLYNGPIKWPLDKRLIDLCNGRRRRGSVCLILVTNGGDASCAYRTARALQRAYGGFRLFVPGNCKSAGTIVALGASELVIGDGGELGPLDVQLKQKDEIQRSQSGLAVMAALTVLQEKANLTFETFFVELQRKSQGAITVKTAGEIATALTAGLFAPIYAQINPLHVGEAGREMAIADHYGTRLVGYGGNASQDAVTHLVSNYPSHAFVIDREEAMQLFHKVRAPEALELALEQKLGDTAVVELSGDPNDAILEFLTPEPHPGDVKAYPREGSEDGRA